LLKDTPLFFVALRGGLITVGYTTIIRSNRSV
jgi:hypothetical protein